MSALMFIHDTKTAQVDCLIGLPGRGHGAGCLGRGVCKGVADSSRAQVPRKGRVRMRLERVMGSALGLEKGI